MTVSAAQEALLSPFLAAPERCAVLMDVDGTLAPIVDRPENAAVPAETTEALCLLADRFALVACVTGRRALEARVMVGVQELVYAGNQGFELLRPSDAEPFLDPAARPRGNHAARFLAELDPDRLAAAGIRQEDKGPIQVLHWRGADDEEAAEAQAEEIAELARGESLIPLWGRKVLDLRPVAGIDKGTAVHRLLVEHAPLDGAVFAGDDRTDLDAFRAMKRLAGSSRLGVAVRVGVASAESPPEIEAEADMVVSGPDGVLEILKALEG
ncbi:MAG: trehalose-phosphatase [Solirubrobacterales bacterium]